MQQSHPTLIPNNLLSAVSAGHIDTNTGISLILLLEIPHMVIGFIEFTNYIAGHWVNGCSNVEENDYVGKFICELFSQQ